MLPLLLLLSASYLIGSIPVGFLIARRHGIDIRSAGSGNIGATNVGRLLGARIGAAVFVLDFLKGAAPVLLALALSTDAATPIAAGLFAFLGHVFPVWLKFRGGKGVATGFGVVAVLLPLPTLGGAIVWLAVLAAARYVSLASLAAAAALTGFHLLLARQPFAEHARILTAFCFVALALVVVRHAGNIVRIAQDRESQVAESAAMNLVARIVHVLSIGLWFGAAVFFLIATLIIFKSLETVGETPPHQREAAFPFREDAYRYTKETGTRIAGVAVAPMFPPYFLIQGGCGFLALVTALGFSRAEPNRRLHRIRFYVVLLAVLTVIVGWPLNQYVGKLRVDRYDPSPDVAVAAKAQFGRWHTYALLLNFATIGLVTGATAMAASLPQRPDDRALKSAAP